ncbi:MAG: nucleotide pyrophosphohydrolase [Anaerolineales bacterium]|nr:nucleotide pyrophosphohydrolase [Anaerolineales bacterium]
MHELVKAKGWYDENSPRQQTPKNLAISLSLEANEVLEHFQWDETIRNKEDLASELADVTLYMLQLASICNIDLEQAVLEKIKINYARTWDDQESMDKHGK